MSFRRALALLPALLLLACSSNQSIPPTVSLAIHGNVHGGQQAIVNSSIQLYAVGLSGGGSPSTALLAASVKTDTDGNFSIIGDYACPTAESQVYAVAQGGNPGLASGIENAAIVLAAALGRCDSLGTSTFLKLNEVTTVALATSLAPFATSATALGSTPSDANLVESAFAAAQRFASSTNGTTPGPYLPAGVTVPSSEIDTLANILSTCVNSAGGAAGDSSSCGTLFSLATAAGMPSPTDTFSAAMRLADSPSLNTGALFDLATPTSPFQPQLATAPANFAVAAQVKAGLQISASFISFGAVTVGTSAPVQTFVLTNNSASALPISSLALTGNDPSDFVVNGSCPASLAPSGTCSLQIAFNPTGTGRRVAGLAIANGSSIPMLLTEVSGTGVSLPSASPTVTAASPGSVLAGSADTVLTLTGTGFTPGEFVYVANSWQSSIFHSTQSISVTLSSSLLVTARNLPIYVRTSAGTSNTLTLPVVSPAPSLSAISPASVLASAPAFSLTVTGSGFQQSSTVLINGVSHATQFGGPTSLSTTVLSTEIATAGNLNVSVITPAPGGGASGAQVLQVVSTPNRFRTLKYATADIAADPVREVLYASVLSSSATSANSVISVDPVKGTVIATAALSDQPDRLAISDDGSYLYISLRDAGKITRLSLPSLTTDLTWSLPSNQGAADLQVAPGQPHTLAVSVPGTAYGERTINIYDDAVARPLHPGTSYPSISFDTLAWGANASTLFGTNSGSSGGPEFVFSVDANGPTLVNTLNGALGDFLHRLTYSSSTNRLYDGYGHVVDPATGNQIGRYNVQNTLAYEQNYLALDVPNNRVFFLNENYFNQADQSETADIQGQMSR